MKGLPNFCEEPCFSADRVYNKNEFVFLSLTVRKEQPLLIEEKTKEPRQEAPSAPPVKRGQKLRSRWAQFQCSRLLRKHRFRRRTQYHMNNLSQKLRGSAVVLTVGEALYALGFAAEYTVVRAGRNVAALLRWLWHGIRNAPTSTRLWTPCSPISLSSAATASARRTPPFWAAWQCSTVCR